MRRMSSMSKIIPMLALLVVITVGMNYMYGVLSVNDNNINVTGTAYEQSYESNTAIQSATSQLFIPVAFLLGLGMLFITISMLKKKRY